VEGKGHRWKKGPDGAAPLKDPNRWFKHIHCAGKGGTGEKGKSQGGGLIQLHHAREGARRGKAGGGEKGHDQSLRAFFYIRGG